MYVLEENTLGGALFAGMSAIDIALWDILGKKLNVPVYKLLGGKIHDRLRIYTSYRWGEIPRTADAYRKRTQELIEQGATAGKYDPFGPYPGPDRQLSTPILNEVREMIRGIREGGPSFDICVEAHGKWNIATAGRIIKMLEPFDPFFLEEPVPPEDVDAMAALQRSTNIPIATGEGLQTHWNFRELMNKQAARIIQPDVARTGGITSMKKIAAMADANYVTVAPHNPNGPICSAASMHVAASIPNFVIMEEGSKSLGIGLVHSRSTYVDRGRDATPYSSDEPYRAVIRPSSPPLRLRLPGGGPERSALDRLVEFFGERSCVEQAHAGGAVSRYRC